MEKIVIQTDADFTPPGKRRVRVVTCSNGHKQIRAYVSGRRYCVFHDLALAMEWQAAQ